MTEAVRDEQRHGKTQWLIALCGLAEAPFVMCVNPKVPGQKPPEGMLFRFDRERRTMSRELLSLLAEKN